METEVVNNGRYVFIEVMRQPYHRSTGLLNRKLHFYYCYCETHRITCKQVASVINIHQILP